MVIRPDNDLPLRRTSTTWSALKGEPLVSLAPGNLVQQFIDRHLTRAGVFVHPRAVFNYLDTMIAMVEAGEGIAVIPSFVLPACRNRKVVMGTLSNPVVNLDLCRISLRGKRLPPGADDFTSFLQAYIARWAGSAGILCSCRALVGAQHSASARLVLNWWMVGNPYLTRLGKSCPSTGNNRQGVVSG